MTSFLLPYYIATIFSPFTTTAQPPELFYLFQFSNQSDWTIENVGNGVETSSTTNTCPNDQSLCWELQGLAMASRIIPTTGYHTVRIIIDVVESGMDAGEWCYIQYRTANTDWNSNINIVTKGDWQSFDTTINVDDNSLYNDQATFKLRIGNSGTAHSDSCYWDNLRIFGIPYTNNPTTNPTFIPTYHPTYYPTTDPTFVPTFIPTHDPTNDPTFDPTYDPTADPTHDPTHDPTLDPTLDPTHDPTMDPTHDPTTNPTQPTIAPTFDPTQDPTTDPTHDPTTDPTLDPTIDPTIDPTMDPTSDPTSDPTNDPTIQPTPSPILKIPNFPTPKPTHNTIQQPQGTDSELPNDDNELDSQKTAENESGLDLTLIGVLLGVVVCLIITSIIICYQVKKKKKNKIINKMVTIGSSEYNDKATIVDTTTKMIEMPNVATDKNNKNTHTTAGYVIEDNDTTDSTNTKSNEIDDEMINNENNVTAGYIGDETMNDETDTEEGMMNENDDDMDVIQGQHKTTAGVGNDEFVIGDGSDDNDMDIIQAHKTTGGFTKGNNSDDDVVNTESDDDVLNTVNLMNTTAGGPNEENENENMENDESENNDMVLTEMETIQ